MTDEFTPPERHALDRWTALEPPTDFAERVLSLGAPRRWLPYAIAGSTSAVAAAAILLLVLRPEIVVEQPPITPTYDASPAVEPPTIDAGATLITDAPLKPPEDSYDLDVEVGQSATIHTLNGITEINFWGRTCKAGMQVALHRDPTSSQYRRANQGSFGVVLEVEAGEWTYRASCMAGGMPEAPYATGQITVLRDAGLRPLSQTLAALTLEADGGTYRVSHPGVPPDVTIKKPLGGEQLHVTSPDGKSRTINLRSSAEVKLPGVDEGIHTVWFSRGGVTIGKVTKVIVEFDPTAPQVQLLAPVHDATRTPTIEVRGITMPGWKVSFEGAAIRTDAQHRFIAKVSLRPDFYSLGVRFDHPKRGTHYYVRHLKR